MGLATEAPHRAGETLPTSQERSTGAPADRAGIDRAAPPPVPGRLPSPPAGTRNTFPTRISAAPRPKAAQGEKAEPPVAGKDTDGIPKAGPHTEQLHESGDPSSSGREEGAEHEPPSSQMIPAAPAVSERAGKTGDPENADSRDIPSSREDTRNGSPDDGSASSKQASSSGTTASHDQSAAQTARSEEDMRTGITTLTQAASIETSEEYRNAKIDGIDRENKEALAGWQREHDGEPTLTLTAEAARGLIPRRILELVDDPSAVRIVTEPDPDSDLKFLIVVRREEPVTNIDNYNDARAAYASETPEGVDPLIWGFSNTFDRSGINEFDEPIASGQLLKKGQDEDADLYVGDFTVGEPFRQRGIAKSFYSTLRDFAREQNFKYIVGRNNPERKIGETISVWDIFVQRLGRMGFDDLPDEETRRRFDDRYNNDLELQELLRRMLTIDNLSHPSPTDELPRTDQNPPDPTQGNDHGGEQRVERGNRPEGGDPPVPPEEHRVDNSRDEPLRYFPPGHRERLQDIEDARNAVLEGVTDERQIDQINAFFDPQIRQAEIDALHFLEEELVGPLSVIPDENQWKRTTEEAGNQVREILAQFTSEEVAAIEDARIALRLIGKNPIAAVSEVLDRAKRFPRSRFSQKNPAPSLVTRRPAVAGMLLTAQAAEKALNPLERNQPPAPEGEIADALRTLAQLPGRLNRPASEAEKADFSPPPPAGGQVIFEKPPVPLALEEREIVDIVQDPTVRKIDKLLQLRLRTNLTNEEIQDLLGIGKSQFHRYVRKLHELEIEFPSGQEIAQQRRAGERTTREEAKLARTMEPLDPADLIERANELSREGITYDPPIHPKLTKEQVDILFRALHTEEEISLRSIIRNPEFLGDTKQKDIQKWAYAYAQSGDIRSFIVFCHSRLATRIAKNSVTENFPLEEAISAANDGLSQAVNRYEYDRPEEIAAKFSTFARYWIKKEIMRSKQKEARIASRRVFDGIGRVNRIQAAYQELWQRNATRGELDQQLRFNFPNMSDRERTEVLETYFTPVSERSTLQERISADTETERGEMIADTRTAAGATHVEKIDSLRTHIDAVLRDLTDEDAEVVRVAFNLGETEKTLAELAEERHMDIDTLLSLQQQLLIQLRDNPIIQELFNRRVTDPSDREKTPLSGTAIPRPTEEITIDPKLSIREKIKYLRLQTSLTANQIAEYIRVSHDEVEHHVRSLRRQNEIPPRYGSVQKRRNEAQSAETRAVAEYLKQHRPHFIGRPREREGLTEFDERVRALISEETSTGERLSRTEIANRLGVSRIAVSKSLQRLLLNNNHRENS